LGIWYSGCLEGEVDGERQRIVKKRDVHFAVAAYHTDL